MHIRLIEKKHILAQIIFVLNIVYKVENLEQMIITNDYQIFDSHRRWRNKKLAIKTCRKKILLDIPYIDL